MNEIKGYLRDFRIDVPEVIYTCKGLKIFGRRIKSIVFSIKKKLIKSFLFFSRYVSLGILKPLSFRKERFFYFFDQT